MAAFNMFILRLKSLIPVLIFHKILILEPQLGEHGAFMRNQGVRVTMLAWRGM